MAVYPVAFYPNGNVDLWHSERGHGGTVAITSLPYSVNPVTGAEDDRFVVVPCPACPSISAHPASGGGSPEVVQALHILKRARAGRAFAQAKADVEALTEADAGPGRFKLARAARSDLEAGKLIKPQVADRG